MLRFKQILPTPATVPPEKQPSSPFRPQHILPRRLRGQFFSLLIIATITLFFYYNYYTLTPPSGDLLDFLTGLPQPEGGSHPPRFYEWHDREKLLPQHNPDLPYPQGREGRYIRFTNQVCCVGWGNSLQEILLNAHLAYLSKRTYVFDNYTWDKSPGDFSSFNGKTITARVPLTALLSGPIAGDPFPSSAVGTPAVIPEFFDQVCPTRTVIDRNEVNSALGEASAATIVQAWLDKLERTEDRCVEIKDHTPQVFDFWLFGDSTRLLDIWPSFSASPILTHFSWSPLITAALAANAQFIHPGLSSVTPSSFVPSSNPPPLSGLLAVHIRRGDYIDHCKHLANWTSTYLGFNELPGLPDRLARPASTGTFDDRYGFDLPPEEQARYRRHCFPDIEQIVSRVREVRAELLPTTKLTRVYVMTNGKPEWLRELKDALQEDARRLRLREWEHIGTSRDLRLTGEQKHNSQAADMAVGQRAEVFIGNGFSSMTSSVTVLRAAQGRSWDKTRFW